jgi:type II secretory pathway pseudopilin PulG
MILRQLLRPASARRRRDGAGRQSGLTTVEAVGMTIILGLMAGLAYPAIYGLRQSGMDQQAIGVAQTLNQAQQTYSLRVSNAEVNWEAAPDSSAKYQLVSSYVPFSTATLSDYVPVGYTMTLGATLNTKVVITNSQGIAISY